MWETFKTWLSDSLTVGLEACFNLEIREWEPEDTVVSATTTQLVNPSDTFTACAVWSAYVFDFLR